MNCAAKAAVTFGPNTRCRGAEKPSLKKTLAAVVVVRLAGASMITGPLQESEPVILNAPAVRNTVPFAEALEIKMVSSPPDGTRKLRPLFGILTHAPVPPAPGGAMMLTLSPAVVVDAFQ